MALKMLTTRYVCSDSILRSLRSYTIKVLANKACCAYSRASSEPALDQWVKPAISDAKALHNCQTSHGKYSH